MKNQKFQDLSEDMSIKEKPLENSKSQLISRSISRSELNDFSIIITGGGSGGHLNIAFNIIEGIKKYFPKVFENAVFIGGKKGMIGDSNPSLESRKVPKTGIKFFGIRSGKLHRQFKLISIKLLFGIFGGLIDAYKIIKNEKYDLIISTGGYVTVPVVVVGKLKGIKVIIHEQTSVAGLANKINAKFADKIWITFSSSKKYFDKKKVELLNPFIRESRLKKNQVFFENLDKDYKSFLQNIIKSDKKFIFFTGGGLGSHKINMWILKNLEKLAQKYNILIQTGENQLFDDYSKLETKKKSFDINLQKNIFIIKWFEKEIAHIYEIADLVIGRPGVNTMLEVLATQNRAIFIPIPWSSNNEQRKNAEYFLKKQTGAIFAEKDLKMNNGKLLNLIDNILKKEKVDYSIKTTSSKEIAYKIMEFLNANCSR